MAVVALKFVPPSDADITTLHIEESATEAGAYVEIHDEPAGVYPDYIAELTVTNATSATGWFRVRWSDADGAFTQYSEPWQGGTTNLVHTIKDRVMQRDPSLVDAIVYQEVEAIVAEYFGVLDPYDTSLTASYKALNGLTYLALARSYIFEQIKGGDAESVTLGLVSFKSARTGRTVDVEKLIDLANASLGLNTSVVLQMEEIVRQPYYVNVMEP